MCGIAGIFVKPEKSVPDLHERLGRMTLAMRHRGPDDQGVHVTSEGRAGLANCRLAIRDLSPAGHMPMGNADGSVWITYNGEIYNTEELRPELERLGYIFHSRSDTEVILHGYEAWGEEVVKRLRGMFAFAILDERQGRLVIARDHMGIKPLYYARSEDAFIFASELKGLLAAGLTSREISPAGLIGYLLMGSVPNPLTIYRDVTALEPSCRLSLALDQPHSVEPRSYWHLPTDTIAPLSYGAAIAEVRDLLAEAVRIRLVSDVPLGAFLSGGIDSSAVVALMRQATDGPIRTCSMVFEEAGYSEAPFARAVAEAAGADHYERVITAGDMAKEFDNILWAMDQPTVDGVNTYFVSQTARQAGLTVALSGLGGDELFGGYPNTFREAPQMLRAFRAVQRIPGGSGLARAAINMLPDRRRWSKVQDALARPASPASAYVTRRGLFSLSEVKGLVNADIWQAGSSFDHVRHIAERADNCAENHSSLSWTSRAELRTYTHHQLLRDTDVMSMAHSLEVRVPLLDKRLVETLLRFPDGIKTNYGSGQKPLLVQALGNDLPALVRKRREKQGFTFPFDIWLRGKLKAKAEAVTNQAELSEWLHPERVNSISQDFQVGRMHWSRPWALVALGAMTKR